MKKLALLSLALAIVAGIALSLLWEDTTEPQKAAPRVVAMVQLTAVDANTVAGFQEKLAQLGYRENSEIVYLSTGPVGQVDKLESVIQNHLTKQPDLIFVSSTPATQAVKRLTDLKQHPPIVFAPVNDPLAAGIVSDLRRPGGHITGIRLPTGDDLRLQWLLRIAPHAKRIYLPFSKDDRSSLTSLKQASEAAEKLGIKLLPQALPPEGGVSAAIAALPADADAIFLPRDSRIEAGIETFVAEARKRRLPLSAPSLIQVQAGALVSYGFVHKDIGRQAARLADQIFRGVAPGDLPVEMAESRLAINLAAAREIGITIPDDIIAQAEYVLR
jgi:putative ABC transport system substrate-binding protein